MQPLWERFVAHKLDSSFTQTPVKYLQATGIPLARVNRMTVAAGRLLLRRPQAITPCAQFNLTAFWSQRTALKIDSARRVCNIYHTISAEYASHTGTHSIPRSKPGDKLRFNESEERRTPNAVGISRAHDEYTNFWKCCRS